MEVETEAQTQNTGPQQTQLTQRFDDINDRFFSNSSEPIPGDVSADELRNFVYGAFHVVSGNNNSNGKNPTTITTTTTTTNDDYTGKLSAIAFLINAFRHSENEALRRITLGLVSVRILASGSAAVANPDLVDRALRDYPRLHSAWKAAVRRRTSKASSAPTDAEAGCLVPDFVEALVAEAEGIRPGASFTVSDIQHMTGLTSPRYLFVVRCVEFTCDLLSQLPTRRFFHTYLRASNAITRLCRTALYNIQSSAAAALSGGFPQMVGRLEALDTFAVDDFSGTPLSPADVAQQRAEHAQTLQRVCYRMFPGKLRSLALANIAAVQDRTTLSRHLARLTSAELSSLAAALTLLPPPSQSKDNDAEDMKDDDDNISESREFVTEVILRHFTGGSAKTDGERALFPTERDLWPLRNTTAAAPRYDIFEGDEDGAVPLGLPNLNLQFLSADDYLQRNFELFRCESVYGAREALERAIRAMCPYANSSSRSSNNNKGSLRRGEISGVCRMALPLREARLVRVAQPALGDTKPSEVICELSVTLDKCPQQTWRAEWENIRRHDILYAVTVQPGDTIAEEEEKEENGEEQFRTKYGVVAVRGCEVVDVLDATTGVSLLPARWETSPDPRRSSEATGRNGGALRTIRVRMDSAQYAIDNEERAGDGVRELYGSFNLVVRRREEESNYKAVLETIRSLMSTESPVGPSSSSSGRADDMLFFSPEIAVGGVPEWLENTILGYYTPNNSDNDDSNTNNNNEASVDLYDTFIDEAHLKSVYPNINVKYEANTPINSDCHHHHNHYYFRVCEAKGEAVGYIPSHQFLSSPSPLSYNNSDHGKRPRNSVPFTAAQAGAIRAAMGGGLTLVEGPPGTGKTDVAVQIVSNLYHSGSRVLVVTKSNHALNQVFEKLVGLDIDERHCLRLGHGERTLETTRDFSPRGRVDHILQRRIAALRAVDALAVSLGVAEHEAYAATCEAALLFRRLYVLPRWEAFCRTRNNTNNNNNNNSNSNDSNGNKSIEFPFAKFFADVGVQRQSLSSSGNDYDDDDDDGNKRWERLEALFRELREMRPFELLRTQGDRTSYLLTHEARIVAMTATYAALRRRDLEALGFRCDAIVMEEAAQILEVEAFVPLVLLHQEATPGTGTVAGRVVMIGDHRQLPPVVKCPALRSACHFDQSMFTRLVRLGVPCHVLDAQGRARECLAALYSWAYPGGLRTLPSLLANPRFAATAVNPGFAHTQQFVDVPGVQEAAPAPHFYQNVAEAEFLVHTYIYMRLLGYPRESIAVLTTYNGQRSLLRDVVAERCCKTQALRDLVGAPAYVGTVDKFQGRQCDYVLLSLVRTAAVGHLRDPRRLVVALSRARLGLYVFGSKALFQAHTASSSSSSSAANDLKKTLATLFGTTPSTLQLVPSERWSAAPYARSGPEAVKSVANVDELLAVIAPLVSTKITAATASTKSVIKNKTGKDKEEKESDVQVENGGALIESLVDVNDEDVIIPVHTSKEVRNDDDENATTMDSEDDANNNNNDDDDDYMED